MSKDSETRDFVVFLAALETAMDKMIAHLDLDSSMARRAKTAKTHAKVMMQELIEELPDTKKRAVWNYANNTTLKAVPSLSPEAKRDYCIVESDALRDLAEAACDFCLKTEKEAKRCETRKKLERCGIFGDVEGTSCPFKLIDGD